MSPEERARRADGLRAIVMERDPGDWIDDQLADIGKKGREGLIAGAGDL
jgi:trehalose 6-phosphate synthase